MSPTTETDERIARARSLIQEAHDILGSLLVQRPWGWDSLRPEYQRKLRQAAADLSEINEEIEP